MTPNRIKTSKPLPLLPEEERELLPRGKPTDPQGILNNRPYVPVGQQVRVGMGLGMRALIWLLGIKCVPLIFNYFRMGRPILGVLFLIVYFAWIIAWFLSFVLAALLVQENNTSILTTLILLLIVVGLPFTPRLLAWVQQGHYDQWVRDFADQRQDYLSKKI